MPAVQAQSTTLAHPCALWAMAYRNLCVISVLLIFHLNSIDYKVRTKEVHIHPSKTVKLTISKKKKVVVQSS